MLSKEKVHAEALRIARSKLEAIQNEFDALQESLLSETKSSAGDKHETGRAMAQLEQEKLSRQLTENRKTLEHLHQINPLLKFERVEFGSLVKTNRGYFFVSAGIGQITIGNETAFCITAGSPIGQKLLGKTANDSVQMNGTLLINSVS